MQNKSSNIIDLKDLKFLGRVISKNWWIVLIVVLLSYSASFLYSYKLTDIFAAKTQILLKSNDQYNSGSIIGENFASSAYYGGYQSYIDNTNEKRVIQSFDLIQRAIDRLKFDVSYFIVGRIVTKELFEGIPFNVQVDFVNSTVYEQRMQFKILSTEQFQLTYTQGQKEIVKKFYFNKEIIDTDFKIRVDKTELLNKNSIDDLGKIEYQIQIHNHLNLVYTFQSALKVEVPEFTNILEVTVKDVLPQRAAVFLDTLAKVYIENTLKSRLEINRNTLFYIDKQMEEVTDVLNNIEDTMQSYKENKSILDLSREEKDYFDKLSEYDGLKTRLRLSIGALDDLEKYVIEARDPAFLPPSIYVNSDDEFLKKSASELYSMQLSKNGALNGATYKNYAVEELDAKMGRLKNDLLTYITNSRKAFNEKIENVQTEIDNYISHIKTIPQKQRDLVNIQRKLGVNENMYVFLLQRRANTIIARAGIIPETKVIESARSIGLVEPNRSKITYSFMGFGLLLSILMIIIRTVFYDRIESLEELKEKTKLPILGEILLSKDVKELIVAVESDAKSPITESFRSIRTNLQYFSPDIASKLVLVTSNSPGEGKTFCSINIGAILAKAGKKVLLLELDLHKPKIQVGLNMKSDLGISTILIGKTLTKDVILPSPLENMDVLLSGPVPPNASELILSKHLPEMFDYGKEHYDYVIVDTPPVGLISDAIYMMRFADISLFVINTKFASKNSVQNAEEIVKSNNISNFGIILNGVKSKRSRYYYNRYNYGYGYGGYGYGYGYGNEKKK